MRQLIQEYVGRRQTGCNVSDIKYHLKKHGYEYTSHLIAKICKDMENEKIIYGRKERSKRKIYYKWQEPDREFVTALHILAQRPLSKSDMLAEIEQHGLTYSKKELTQALKIAEEERLIKRRGRKFELDEKARKIYSFLSDQAGPRAVKEIAKGTDHSSNELLYAIHKLKRYGLIERIAKGKYKIAPTMRP